MNWEDFPQMSTQPIGVQGDGTIVTLHPPAIGTRTVTPPLNSPMWNLNPPPLNNSAQLVTVAGGPVTLASLPTTDPLVAGQIWNDGGVPTVSAG